MKSTITSKEACTIAHKIRRETGCSLAEAFKAAYAGNNTVNSKTSWTADELNQIFSDKAAELLRKSYIIDTAAMSGHQGEIGKIVFKKNNDYYILVMESKSDCRRGKYDEHYTIRFGKYTEKVENHGLNTWITLWIEKFDTIWSLEFVKVTDNYFVTPELAEEFNEKCHNRLAVKYPSCVARMDDRYTKAILPLVRKQKGFKGTKLSDIVRVERINRVNYDGQPVRRYYKVVINKKNSDHTEIVDVRF